MCAKPPLASNALVKKSTVNGQSVNEIRRGKLISRSRVHRKSGTELYDLQLCRDTSCARHAANITAHLLDLPVGITHRGPRKDMGRQLCGLLWLLLVSCTNAAVLLEDFGGIASDESPSTVVANANAMKQALQRHV